MLLFGRRRSLNPARSRAAVAFAVEVASRAREVTGHDVFAWSTFASPEAGSILWSARLEALSELEAAQDKMAVDSGYMDFVESGADLFTGPTVDTLTQIVGGTPDGSPMAYVQIVQATCAPGKLSGGMAFGVELAEAVARVTGRSCLLGASMTGAYGGVGWIVGAPDADALVAANDAWGADAGAIAMTDRAGEFYESGASVSILRRLN